MEKIQFAVSAKTARLIGRENISGVDGAVIELIKNAYDADATCVFVQFNIPFPTVPQSISFTLATTVLAPTNLPTLLRFYTNNGKCYEKRRDLSIFEEKELNDFLFSYNTITVMDNGCGMNETILRSAWMNIGTNDKEERKVSPGGRVKTGAKGIGRFALDKLSTATTVYTKSSDDSFKKWQIDWRQFDTAQMLEEVTATIENATGSYFELATKVAKSKIKSFDQYNWDTGTTIMLNPMRENWSIPLFSRIIRNLKSLFPGTNDSHFDIYVNNVFYPAYSFANERFALVEGDYDYKILGNFDGKDSLTIKITRNEVDTRKIKLTITEEDQQREVYLNEFWSRDAFQKDNYHRSDYTKEITIPVSVTELTKLDPALISTVGPFSAEFYFLKNTNSTIDIVKTISVPRRKVVLENYSGIKLYRDGFKVRPYGEDGPSFDWIGLSERARKSPGAVSSDGAWRVRTNQVVGAVRISKDGNPNLIDMANREGLAVNDAYTTFVLILEKIIETFEGDRQRVFQEFSSWIEYKKKTLFKSHEVIESVKGDQKTTQSSPTDDKHRQETETDGPYSSKDYKRAVLVLEKKNERTDQALKTLMLYSSAGVMTNTFSHEISRITTNKGSRMQHLRHAVKRLVGEDGYTGNPLFDPFTIINQTEKVDRLLESWLGVIMSGSEHEAFYAKSTNICSVIDNILAAWKPLLEQKLIKICPLVIKGNIEDCSCDIAEIDLHIILNNFLLNSAWFLEKATVIQREIYVTVEAQATKIIILLENNGPPLDSMFSNNPDRIFFPGESSKKRENGEGTGLGLWITKLAVDGASGEIHPMDKQDGFGLRITLPK